MVSLWRRDRETVWALNSLTRHRGHYYGPLLIGSHHHRNGYLLIVSAPNRPYGTATQGPVRATHIAQQVVLAWKQGTFRGAQAQWLCGHRTESFVLENAPTYPICRMCYYRMDGKPPMLVQVNIGSIHIRGTT